MTAFDSAAAPLTPITTLTPNLAALLKQRAKTVLDYLVETNSKTTYFREADPLCGLRAALGKNEHGTESDAPRPIKTMFETFSDAMPLTNFDDYRPFISRFMQAPRHESKVSDLFAPGLPLFVVTSSGTAGGAAKYLLKYRHPLSLSSSGVNALKACHPPARRGGSSCVIFNLRHTELLDIVGSDGKEVTKKVPLCLASSVAFRLHHRWLDPENDESLMTEKVPTNTSPLAICFIHSYRTSLLLHALFALEDRTLEIINTLFCPIFLDMARLIEEYWDQLIQALDTGIVPDFEGVEEVKDHLQDQLKPNPKRAAELRQIGVDTSSPGWIKRIWPNLDRVLGNSSGMFSRVVPQIQRLLGPSVHLEGIGLTSSEAWIAQIYDPKSDLNLYKMSTDDLFEYLEITKPETAPSLCQSWELETGKSYELILTTRDGLWRYRLGDIVEIGGFDPKDGQPLIRYSERRNVTMRASGEFVTEKELQDAVQSLEDILGPVMEFTTIVDDRPVPRAYGFLIELQDKPGPHGKTAPARIHDYLLKANETYAQFTSRALINVSSVRILKHGTFRSYREWKTEGSPSGSGQIKVPTVVYNVEVRDWLLERVIEEL